MFKISTIVYNNNNNNNVITCIAPKALDKAQRRIKTNPLINIRVDRLL